MIPRVYVAGAYTDSRAWVVESNCAKASIVGDLIVEHGGIPIVPHEVGHRRASIQTDYEWWCEATMSLMHTCYMVVVVPGYENSKGTLAEIAEAEADGMLVFYAKESGDILVLPGECIREINRYIDIG